MIIVQEAPFDSATEVDDFMSGTVLSGGHVFFVGTVRQFDEGMTIAALELEHYPAMTESVLEELVAQAKRKWSLQKVKVIHRFGKLYPGEKIVFVGVSSAHRLAAFEACHFLIDFLKTKAPFWKLEHSAVGSAWVEAKQSDDNASALWD